MYTYLFAVIVSFFAVALAQVVVGGWVVIFRPFNKNATKLTNTSQSHSMKLVPA